MLSLRPFSLQLTIQKSKENSFKTNITPHGETFDLLIYWDKIWNLEGYIFEKLFNTEKLWDGLPVF